MTRYWYWLLPTAHQEKQLAQVMRFLCQAVGSRYYPPHMTLGTAPRYSTELCARVCSDVGRITARNRGIERERTWSRSLYLRLSIEDDGPDMLRSLLGLAPPSSVPHLNLVYTDKYDMLNSTAFIEQLEGLPLQISFDRIGIVKAAEWGEPWHLLHTSQLRT